MSAFSNQTAAPYSKGQNITPTDGVTFGPSGIYVGGAGNVTVRDVSGTLVQFLGVTAGSVLPILCTEVRATDLTASGIVRCF